MSDETVRRPPSESGLSDVPTGQLRAPAVMPLEAAGRTDTGRVRAGNEDAFAVEPPSSPQARARGTLLIVSDGMGGHAAGEVASRLAVETTQATFYRLGGLPAGEAVRSAITAANGAIYESATRDAQRSGMGCTIVAIVVQGSELAIGNVGDSRAYLIRGGRAQRLTRDHSWVAMQVEEGILTPEQAEHHPNRSLLTRALGRQPAVEVDIAQHQLQAGDALVLCSDGLTAVVNEAEIGEYASRYAPTAVADQLINLANQRGAPDNVTVVAAAIGGPAAIGGAANHAATTVIVPPADATPPTALPAPGDTATARNLHRPDVAGAAIARPDARPAGTPLVVSRGSVAHPDRRAGRARRGPRRWLAGALAAFGLAAGLVLLTLLRPNVAGDPEGAPVADAPPPAVTATTAEAARSAPAAVPPPVATGLPGLTAPGAGAAATAAPTTASIPATTAPAGAGAQGAVAGAAATPPQPAIAAASPAATVAPTPQPPAPTPTTQPAATATPVADVAPEQPAGPAESTGPLDVAGSSEATGPADAPAADADAPATDDAMAPADASTAEAAPVDAPAPPPPAAAPRLAPPAGIDVPGIPGLRPRKRGD
jgi:protein phosphatase